jgi:alpha-L-fucosidase 2
MSLIGGGVFPIDADFGYPAALVEMLLQSHLKGENGYRIHLLPALPKAWPTGSVTVLRARGEFEVDITWKKGKLTHARLRSIVGAPCTLRYGAKEIPPDDEDRGKHEF